MLSLKLAGKTALIGGSSQGIGLAVAQALAAQGAKCILLARGEDKLRVACMSLEDTPPYGKHEFLVGDYSKPAELISIVREYLFKTPIDILINNTGGPAGGQIMNAKPEEFISAFNQHLICNHLLTTVVAEKMKERGFGRIINIISTYVKIPLKDLGVSNTIRGAVASWAKTMANELGQYGITVNNVLPGATLTERLTTIIKNKAEKTGKAIQVIENEMLQEIPARRFGKPEEIASLVAFLATDGASYINGASIPVDGGRTGSI